MKFNLIIISILIAAFSLYGNDQLKEVKTKIDHLNNEQLFKITAQPRVLQQTIATWSDTTWLPFTRTRFTYLVDESVDQEFEDVFGFSGWEDYNRWQYHYNQSDLLENIYGERYNLPQWDTLDWRQHSYYGDGKLKEITRSVLFPMGWWPTQKELYEYNAQGQVSKLFLQQPYSPTEWYYTYLFETTYNNKGQVSELYSYTSDTGDSTWSLSYKMDYVYDQNDIEQEVVFSIWNSGDGTWIPSSRTINTITDGKITEIKYQANYGQGWEDTDRDFLEYDLNNNLSSIQSQQYWSSVWQNTRLKTFEYDPASSVQFNSQNTTARDYQLYDNYPNPFNPETSIKFYVPKAGYINLQVFNLLGKSVATLVNQNTPAGEHTVKFNGSNLANGVYFYRLETAEFLMTKKLMLLK
jgi:hypothetical protein